MNALEQLGCYHHIYRYKSRVYYNNICSCVYQGCGNSSQLAYRISSKSDRSVIKFDALFYVVTIEGQLADGHNLGVVRFQGNTVIPKNP